MEMDREICFTHVPKTGGMSILQSLDDEVTYLGAPERNVRCGRTRSGRCFTVIGHDNRSVGNETLESYTIRHSNRSIFTFSFVRNPYDRLISAFEYLRAGGMHEYDRRDALKLLGTLDISFEAFVIEILATTTSRALAQMHLRPQIEWLADSKSKLIPEFVGRFETLEADYDTICRARELSPAPLKKVNASRRHSLQSYYTPQLQHEVYRIYKADFNAFGYPFSLPA